MGAVPALYPYGHTRDGLPAVGGGGGGVQLVADEQEVAAVSPWGGDVLDHCIMRNQQRAASRRGGTRGDD